MKLIDIQPSEVLYKNSVIAESGYDYPSSPMGRLWNKYPTTMRGVYGKFSLLGMQICDTFYPIVRTHVQLILMTKKKKTTYQRFLSKIF